MSLNVELFHIAADGSDYEVALAVTRKQSNSQYVEWDVLAYTSVRRSVEGQVDSIENFIDGYVSHFRNNGVDIFPYRLGWDCKRIRNQLKMPQEQEIRCKELIKYLSVDKNMKFNF